ncbi:hypothetical protein SLEP1_g28952 [Rubroshorea leprosula]|uniref:Uncharacterized protein n=1 Tax=Rubroshorea leprosula TaxID=152421 RepID=A0AAV5K4Q2_9ROSI|nr:hypothetical protein SLEP1_g28952 [Rubroshorea leprosula]
MPQLVDSIRPDSATVPFSASILKPGTSSLAAVTSGNWSGPWTFPISSPPATAQRANPRSPNSPMCPRTSLISSGASITECALKALPGSYKLWNAYLRERLEIVRNLPVTHPKYDTLNNTFERALVTMHKMPRIWIMYLQTLTEQKLITRTRRSFDRALCALSVTQQDRIWEPYLSVIAHKMESLDLSDEEEEDIQEDTIEEDEDIRLDVGLCKSKHKFERKIFKGFWLHDDKDIDLRLARLENLMNRRPELANSVLLRQNPHNVEQWHRRVKIFEGSPTKQILTYTEAVRTVDPMKAVGKPHTLWVAFAKLYENHKDIANARVIFDKAVQVNYKTVDHLASVWCEWAEMELRHKNFKGALELMRRATAEPSVEVKRRELEKSLGEIDRARGIYVFASQFADPRTDGDFWNKWHEFEVQHGNEDTFREMLRIKRSVSASYSQTHFILPEYMMQKDQSLTLDDAKDKLKQAGVPEDEMAALERQLAPASKNVNSKDSSRKVGFVSAGVESQTDGGMKPVASEDIDLPEESDSEDEERVEIAQKDVPTAVFGGLVRKRDDGDRDADDDIVPAKDRESESRLGALERIKRQKKT